MIPNSNGWSIVLTGAWNPMIFRPEWLQGRLTESENISMGVGIGVPLISHRFGFDGLNLIVEWHKLILSPETCEDNVLEKLQKIAIKILNELPHTPILATGINFQFLEEKPTSNLLELFRFSDDEVLKDKGFIVEVMVVNRRLVIEGQIINLKFKLVDGNIVVDFNFHRDTEDIEEAKCFLEKGITKFKNQALNILQDIYNIKPLF